MGLGVFNDKGGDIHSKYLQCVFEPHKVQSRIPTAFPVRSSLFYKRVLKDITIDSSGSCDILIRPWDLYTSTGTATNNASWYNMTPGNYSAFAFEEADAHPMKGYAGGYGKDTGRYTQYRVVSTVCNIKYLGQVTDYAGMYTAALLPGFGDDIETDSMKPTLSQMN